MFIVPEDVVAVVVAVVEKVESRHTTSGDGMGVFRPLLFQDEIASKNAGNAAIPSQTSVPECVSVPMRHAATSSTKSVCEAVLHHSPAVSCATGIL